MKLNALLKTLGFLALAATPVVAGPSAPAPKNPIAPAPVNDDLGITASLGYDKWIGIAFVILGDLRFFVLVEWIASARRRGVR